MCFGQCNSLQAINIIHDVYIIHKNKWGVMVPCRLSISYIMFIVMNNIWPLCQGWLLPWRRGEIPDGGVALTQREELKFLAGINHNTPFVFLHDINIMYDINSLQGIALPWTYSGTLELGGSLCSAAFLTSRLHLSRTLCFKLPPSVPNAPGAPL